MQKNITYSEKIENQLEREEQRFREHGCARRKLKYGSTKHFPLSDRFKWTQTKRQVKSIALLIELLSQRDKYTGEHSARVALMTYRCCMLVEMSKYYRNTITLSAFCHDIGKINISDGILHKEGPLTDAEYEEIKHHPQDGYDLLIKQSRYTHITNGVLYHQERWDGKGYPFGISGDRIPFPARIIAIADSIDAMLSDRPYRKALTPDECYAEIKKNSKIMYEPRLVEIFLGNWNYIVGGIYE